ncbi:membrane-associated Zn-dependent proteases 1 [Trichinella spiralis]|uniref:membrane-associated Zn-dependent proteases 1 n=1 Tax=Trichinella spiralis TaxID=6334 RepID=UPI0001EFE8BE|nr:membrane-associated Zn-dependent proteases 1 [Trichinella spiralis]
MIKIEELGHLIAWHYCGVKELRIPLYVLGNGIPLFIYMGVVMLSLTLPNKRRSAEPKKDYKAALGIKM